MPDAEHDYSSTVPLAATIIVASVRMIVSLAGAVARGGEWLRNPAGAGRHKPGYIPHYSLVAPVRWFYFTGMAVLLRRCRRPVWRVPALMLAAIQCVCDRHSRTLSRALLVGLGRPVTVRAWWRLHWDRCYQMQAARLLLLQSDRLTTEWATEHVRIIGRLPPGGAILVGPHHDGFRLGLLALAASIDSLGSITSDSHDPADLAVMDPTRRATILARLPHQERVYGGRVFPYREGGRKGLRHLANGGYLVQLTDNFWSSGTSHLVLGRRLPVARGTVWFAERTGKPIVPVMVTSDGRGWRLTIAAPIPPTQEAVIAALEEGIGRAPGSWEMSIGMQWLAAPIWQRPPAGREA